MYIPHSNLRDRRKRCLLSKRVVTQLVDKVICHDINYKQHKRAQTPSKIKSERKQHEQDNIKIKKKHYVAFPVAISRDEQLSRRRATLGLARLHHHSLGKVSSTRIQNRCVLSGRAKAVYKFCRISRIRLRELAGKGLINGVTKSSW